MTYTFRRFTGLAQQYRIQFQEKIADMEYIAFKSEGANFNGFIMELLAPKPKYFSIVGDWGSKTFSNIEQNVTYNVDAYNGIFSLEGTGRVLTNKRIGAPSASINESKVEDYSINWLADVEKLNTITVNTYQGAVISIYLGYGTNTLAFGY